MLDETLAWRGSMQGHTWKRDASTHCMASPGPLMHDASRLHSLLFLELCARDLWTLLPELDLLTQGTYHWEQCSGHIIYGYSYYYIIIMIYIIIILTIIIFEAYTKSA
jgi:hypothetical protein